MIGLLLFAISVVNPCNGDTLNPPAIVAGDGRDAICRYIEPEKRKKPKKHDVVARDA